MELISFSKVFQIFAIYLRAQFKNVKYFNGITNLGNGKFSEKLTFEELLI